MTNKILNSNKINSLNSTSEIIQFSIFIQKYLLFFTKFIDILPIPRINKFYYESKRKSYLNDIKLEFSKYNYNLIGKFIKKSIKLVFRLQ